MSIDRTAKRTTGLYKPFEYEFSGKNFNSKLFNSQPGLHNSNSPYLIGSVTYREKQIKQVLLEERIQKIADKAVKIADIAKDFSEINKHWNVTKKASAKMTQIADRLSVISGTVTDYLSKAPGIMIDSLESLKTSVSETLLNLSLRSLNGVVHEIPGNIELTSWIKPIEQLGAEATQQISIVQGMIAQFRFEETNLSKIIDTLRDKLLKGIDAVINLVKNCANKIAECIEFLRGHVRTLSGKWFQLVEAVSKYSRILSRMGDAIGSFFKVVAKKLPVIGNIIDLWGVSIDRDKYKNDPSNIEAQKEYVISFVGFIVGVVITVATLIFGACVAAPAAVVAVPLAILGAGYAGLSIYMGKDPIAMGLYSLFPENMTSIVEKIETIVSWLGTLPTLVSGWLDKAQAYFDAFILSVRDAKQYITDQKNRFINSGTGEQIGDFLFENLP